MNGKILSICIPVYNRATELKECLDSIEKNYVNGIEVVISDNNSSDETIEVIAEFAKRIPIVWMRKDTHTGFDENCINVISMSSAEYCWILGSDDKVSNGAIRFLIDKILSTKTDIIHFAYVQDKIAIRPISDAWQAELLIADHSAKVDYIGKLSNLSLAFMFISCMVFKRKNWMLNNVIMNRASGSNYVHSFVMHSILNSKSSIYIVNEVLVIARLSKNEWTVDAGKFLLLDSSAIINLYNVVKFDKHYFFAMCRVFKRTYPIWLIFKIMVAGGGRNFIKSKNNLVEIGYGWIGLKVLVILQLVGIIEILNIVNKIKKIFINRDY